MSEVFQTNYSGRAEMELSGGENFEIKVSQDGSAWNTALHVNTASAQVGINKQAPEATLDAAGSPRAQSSRSEELAVENDQVVHIPADRITGMLFLWSYHPSFPVPFLYTYAVLDCGPSESMLSLQLGIGLMSPLVLLPAQRERIHTSKCLMMKTGSEAPRCSDIS